VSAANQYLLRHPFLGGRSLGEDPSLQKITWNATTKTVIYRSKRHHTTKRNFEIFKSPRLHRRHSPSPPAQGSTNRPLGVIWQAIKEWIPDDDPGLNWFNQERDPTGAVPECFDQSPAWRPEEIPIDDGHVLVLDDS
jgi:hypothetical protein